MEKTEKRIKEIHLVTDIYGDGQKPRYLVLEYECALAPESVSAADFEVKDRQIEAVYTNTEPELPEKSVEGSYALLVLSTDYTTPNYGGERGDHRAVVREASTAGTGRTGCRTGRCRHRDQLDDL